MQRAVWCGRRRSELLALRRRGVELLHQFLLVERSFIHLAAGSLLFSAPKTAAGRGRVAIPPRLRAPLEDHLDQHVAPDPDALLATGDKGGPVRNNALQTAWDRARRQIAPHVVLKLGQPPMELPFPVPIVVKALSAQLPHKSEAGGVVVGVRDAVERTEAMSRTSLSVEAAARLPVRFLVQPIVEALGEVLARYRHGPTRGPMVVLAAGGVTAELYADRSLSPAPIDRQTAVEMIGEIVALKALAGYRGAPVGDLEALADAIVAVSGVGDLGGSPELPDILEAEVNSLMVLPVGQGVLAVDGLVVTSAPE